MRVIGYLPVFVGSYIVEPASRQAHVCGESCGFASLALAMQRSDELDLLPSGRSLMRETEQLRRLALTTGCGLQAVWNRSNRCACARSGA